MIELHYDSEGTIAGISYDDDPFDGLDDFPDWVNPRSPVRTLEDHGRSNQADEEMRLQA